MHLLNDFYESNKHLYNIFIVYISEAHASDVWNIGASAGAINPSHQNITDRLMCADKFAKEFDLTIPIYMDNMNNMFETIYACWPVRYMVIKNNKLENISDVDASEVDICKLFAFLKQ